jgi:exopolysaccharide biosynthesis WecB/TagA/CpsF family protein
MALNDNPVARTAAARFAVDAGARFTLIAVGSPQQELIAAEIRDIDNGRGTGLCIGASIDFLAGREKRAPLWMQRLALEWLYRLLGNPARMWRRYLVEGPRIFLLAWRFRR